MVKGKDLSSVETQHKSVAAARILVSGLSDSNSFLAYISDPV